ncbi:hypothetical protein NEILACOT_03496 [Neisseria lactamica ATCC 23970]|uniref:Uncharacterized protein n=1 Tax=Neisseria lactamica ATCC 23970 TaxID=546265 RepID=D0W7J6_NEILA|nr:MULTISPECIES: hypothetical protein [Neisseria]EEZ76381.1 hypothetical protein NEILACOT_03496 [Neisseria lactamica ATCC 23970]
MPSEDSDGIYFIPHPSSRFSQSNLKTASRFELIKTYCILLKGYRKTTL